MKVDVGQWNWQYVLDRINASFVGAGINTITNLRYGYVNGAEYKDVPNGETPTAILDRKSVWREFSERNCAPFGHKKRVGDKEEIIERYYSLLVVPEEYLITYKLFADGLEEADKMVKRIVACFNNGYVDFSVTNPYDENEPFTLRITLSIEKAVRVQTSSQFLEIIKVPIRFTGKCIRMLKMPTENAKNDNEIGDYLGIVKGFECINNVLSDIDHDVRKLNEIQSFKKKTLFMSKENEILGAQYLNHQPFDKNIFDKHIIVLRYFYPNLCNDISSGKKVQGIEELKTKLYNRYKLVYKKSREIYALTGLPLEYYDLLNDITLGMNRDGLSVNDAINHAFREKEAISELTSDISSRIRGTAGDVAKTAAGVAIGNKISGNTGGGAKQSKYRDLMGTAGCAKSHKSIVSCVQCNLYHNCVWGEGHGKY